MLKLSKDGRALVSSLPLGKKNSGAAPRLKQTKLSTSTDDEPVIVDVTRPGKNTGITNDSKEDQDA